MTKLNYFWCKFHLKQVLFVFCLIAFIPLAIAGLCYELNLTWDVFLLNPILQFLLATYIWCVLGIPMAWKVYCKIRDDHKIDTAFVLWLSATLAYLISIIWWIVNGVPKYVAATGIILIFYEFSEFLEDLFQHKMNKNVNSFASLIPSQVKIVDLTNPRQYRWIPLSSVKKHDLLLIDKGDIVPLDGRIKTTGTFLLNTSVWTGSETPQTVGLNYYVSSATFNMGDAFTLAVENSVLESNFQQLLNKANDQSTQSELAKIANRFARVLFYLEIVLFFAVLIGWWLYGSLHLHNSAAGYDAFFQACAMIVAICPCAFGITVPLILLISTNKALKRNILIYNKHYLDVINHLEVVFFDHTGTLTQTSIQVQDFMVSNQNPLYKSIILSLEQFSSHNIALAVVNYLQALNVASVPLTDIVETLGVGIEAKYKGIPVSVISMKEALNRHVRFNGYTGNIIFTYQNDAVGSFNIFTPYRADAMATINALQTLNFEIHIITGDHKLNDPFIQKNILPANIYVNAKPADKAKIVKIVQTNENKHIIFVGDGVNDLLAIKTADLGIALGSSNNLAKLEADIVFLNNNLSSLLFLIKLAKWTKHWVFAIFLVSIIYNLIIIVFIILGVVNVFFAGIAMIFSDVLLFALTFAFYLFRIKTPLSKE